MEIIIITVFYSLIIIFDFIPTIKSQSKPIIFFYIFSLITSICLLILSIITTTIFGPSDWISIVVKKMIDV